MDPKEGDCHTGYGVEDEESVGGGIEVHHHVSAYLMPVEAVAHDFQYRHHFEGADVEHEDVECVVAAIGQESRHDAGMSADAHRDVMKGQEAQNTRERKRGHVPKAGFERHAMET